MNITRKHYARLRQILLGYYHRDLKDAIDMELYAWKLISTTQDAVADLTVLGRNGNRRTVSAPQSGNLFITDLGREKLADYTLKVKEERSPHHELASRLAVYLRKKDKRFTYENIEFSRIKNSQAQMFCVRPDVFSIVPTYNIKNLSPVVHEIKISRSDFFADINKPEKREGYGLIAEKVYYVAPSGMIREEEIPEGCGFLEYDEVKDDFKLVRKAKKNRIEMPTEFFLNLIIKGYGKKPTDLPDLD